GLRPHPAVVLTEGGEERRAEGNIAIPSALALLDPQHHPLAIDVADLQLTELAAPQAGTIEGEQQRAVIEILRMGDQPLHLVGTEDDRQAVPLLRVRQILAHITSLQHMAAEESPRTNLRHDGADRQAAILEEEHVVAS